jgi:XTP/dITP diphosphohydrolase
MKKTIYFITSNKGKALEAKTKFSEINIDVVQKNLGYPEIQADTLEDVAFYGALDVQKRFKHPFFLEDAGLFIDALNGFPGVYSAYIYYTIGYNGILKLLKDIDENKRKACFKSVISYGQPGKKPLIFNGECNGKISLKAIGDYGFGFDPIFKPECEEKTFAQMEANVKNRFSHRGKSLEKLINYFNNL